MKILLRRRPHPPFDGVISPPQLLNIFKIIIFFGFITYIYVAYISLSYRATEPNPKIYSVHRSVLRMICNVQAPPQAVRTQTCSANP